MSDLKEIVARLRFERMNYDDPLNPLYSQNVEAFGYAEQVARDIDEELQAIESNGFAIVPVEPTEAMLDAMWDAFHCETNSAVEEPPCPYKAMLKAYKEAK